MSKYPKKIIVVVGPTASGKSDYALKLAKKNNGYLIGADSQQLYREMNIGTAKDPVKEKDGNYYLDSVPYFMINVINPNENYNVGDYKREVYEILKRKDLKDKLPIIVGGTGLYVKAVVDNLNIPEVEPDINFRREKLMVFKTKGLEYLLNDLKNKDSEAMKFIDPKNPRRVIRALEVIEKTGQKFSELRKQGKKLFDSEIFGIKVDRETLYKRIDLRVNKMIEVGLIEEVKDLVKKYGKDAPGLKIAIGYREVVMYLDGKMDKKEMIQRIKFNTHGYARRQMTFLRKMKEIRWMEL